MDLSNLSFDEELTFSTDKKQLLADIKAVLDKEESQFDYKNLCGSTYKINLKDQPTENLIAVLSYALTRETLVNTRLMLNIQIFVNGYSTFDDSLFESPEIFLSKIEQVLDIKLALLDQLREFQTSIAYWFLACLKSMHKVEYTYIDPVVKLPAIYKRFLFSTNLLVLSSILSKAGDIHTKDLPLVEDAFPVVMELASASALANKMIQNFDFESFIPA